LKCFPKSQKSYLLLAQFGCLRVSALLMKIVLVICGSARTSRQPGHFQVSKVVRQVILREAAKAQRAKKSKPIGVTGPRTGLRSRLDYGIRRSQARHTCGAPHTYRAPYPYPIVPNPQSAPVSESITSGSGRIMVLQINRQELTSKSSGNFLDLLHFGN